MAKIIIKRTRNEAIDAITDAESGLVPRFFFAAVAPLLNGCLLSPQSLRCLLVLSLCITGSYPQRLKQILSTGSGKGLYRWTAFVELVLFPRAEVLGPLWLRARD
ncbi:hypothetical protein Acr_11g0014200 [Actinidia rufa]|uniref:Uncharacterized protein n=1 Tax=Actinidia rufa TaxID=165716 RepID=A0A7J0FEI1_9ERIC|nr:hypothetical protein Acr_11g0014200 [Actinidia rufa]